LPNNPREFDTRSVSGWHAFDDAGDPSQDPILSMFWHIHIRSSTD
jgi:hypothetical protein